MSCAPGDVMVAHDSTSAEVFDEGEFTVVIYESRSGAVQRLEAAAAAVWLAIDGVSTIEEIVADLADTFGESAEVIAPVVNAAFDKFWASGLLEGSPPAQDPEMAGRLDLVLARPPDP